MKIILNFVLHFILIALSISCQITDKNGYTFEKISENEANDLRRTYIHASKDDIKKIFGDPVSVNHYEDCLRFDSIPITIDETDELRSWFGQDGIVPDFTKVIPDTSKYDGFRLHIGLEKDKNNEYQIAYTVTFAKDITSPDDGRAPYLQDNLQLGIYRIFFPNSLVKNTIRPTFFSHRSCNPNCFGDELLK